MQANMVVEGDPPVATMPPEARTPCPVRMLRRRAGRLRARHGTAASRSRRSPIRWRSAGRDADAFAALSRAYVMCLQDRAIQPALQRRMLETAGCDPVIEIDTDHSVWASRPDELAAALNRIAG